MGGGWVGRGEQGKQQREREEEKLIDTNQHVSYLKLHTMAYRFVPSSLSDPKIEMLHRAQEQSRSHNKVSMCVLLSYS